MTKSDDTREARAQINITDALFYILSGGSMAISSVSFLLWLRF